MSIVLPGDLELKIKENLPNVVYVKVIDLSDGCGSKFEVIVVSDEFLGKPLLAQHRLVHKAIEAERAQIHALTLKTKTSEAWNKECSS